jgi:hypothetical protein
MARSVFTAQHREWWRAHASFVLLQARFLAGQPPARPLPKAKRGA